MGEVRFMISEAAKQVKVEAHVLRYWEEELDLTIGRTEMGHRYYTKDDIQLFRCIKKLKDEVMLLKDLKPLIPELKATRLKLQAPQTPDESPAQKEAAPSQPLSSAAGSTADSSPRSAAKEKGKAVHENCSRSPELPHHRSPHPKAMRSRPRSSQSPSLSRSAP